jgi:hypothetical protein
MVCVYTDIFTNCIVVCIADFTVVLVVILVDGACEPTFGLAILFICLLPS